MSAPRGIHPARVRVLAERPRREGAYALYWMQQSQRAEGNHALEHAIAEANARKLPLVVGFGLMDDYPEASARHYAFMLDGLAETARAVEERGARFVLRRGAPDDVALELAANAAILVMDRGYLAHQQRWRKRVADEAPCAVVMVESDVVVPVDVASDHAEHAARTIRPKIMKRLDEHLGDPGRAELGRDARALALPSDLDVRDPRALLAALAIDRTIAPVTRLLGGPRRAKTYLDAFLSKRLRGYAEGRREPSDFAVSFLSPYLHFGQIGVVDVVRRVRDAEHASAEDRAAFVEELVVRRELAANYVRFTPRYDQYDALPAWARRTLAAHAADRREHVWSREQLVAAETHDPYWNAAMREMLRTGYMHNHLRMYWGKKILEWSRTPAEGFATTLALNNAYFLDGRDASSYANVAWCYGLHDRPWPERPIFGTVRSMSQSGLLRKTDADAYVRAVDALCDAEG